MNLLGITKEIIYKDDIVSEFKAADEQRNQQGIGMIAAIVFIVMSWLNIIQGSYLMLATTSISAAFLFIGIFISKYKDKPIFLKYVFYIIFIFVFTMYTIIGGNGGFAALWLLIATYAVMITIDFKVGFVISAYYLVMLILVFMGPLTTLLQYDYDPTFMLRFPLLYAANFTFATYIIIRNRQYQYLVLINQQKLEHLGVMDLSTGLQNRNGFVQYEENFPPENLSSLTAVFIDINGLHEANNCDGHDAGDKMIYDIASLCAKYFVDDKVYRMGGDEFLILCENKKGVDIRDKTDRLREMIEKLGHSISYGIDTQESDFDLDEIVKGADAEMMGFKNRYYQNIDRTKR